MGGKKNNGGNCDPDCARRQIDEIVEPRASELCEDATTFAQSRGASIGSCALNDLDYREVGKNR